MIPKHCPSCTCFPAGKPILRTVPCMQCGGDGTDADWSGFFICQRCKGKRYVMSYDRYDTGCKLDDKLVPMEPS